LSNEAWTDTQENDPRFYKHEDGCGFIKSSEAGVGVLPALLIGLAKKRKVFKKVMAHHERAAFDAKTPEDRQIHLFQEKLFDAKQRATKVTMNSGKHPRVICSQTPACATCRFI
jgi:DNA polymerase elongation subunit (family B)